VDEQLGLYSWQGKTLSLCQHVHTALGPTEPPVQWIEVNWLENKANLSLTASAKVKNAQYFTITPAICLPGMVVMHRAKFNYILLSTAGVKQRIYELSESVIRTSIIYQSLYSRYHFL